MRLLLKYKLQSNEIKGKMCDISLKIFALNECNQF